MTTLVQEWASINSHADNLLGLENQLSALLRAFAALPGEREIHDLPPAPIINDRGEPGIRRLGKALSIVKRGASDISVLLSGHMDTVFAVNSPFQSCRLLSSQRLQGPGVADMKAGLVILLIALEAFERSPNAHKLGWELLISPDEEIGSPGSGLLLQQAAKRHKIGLVFEPSFPDGAFVSARKGSATYTLVALGKAAHAGRNISEGKNAIVLLLPILQQLADLHDESRGLTVNIGHIQGGGPVNIVPDLAIARFGVRAATLEILTETQLRIREIAQGHSVQLIENSYRPPKVLDPLTQQLFREIQRCANDLQIPMQWRETGGVCDGNILAAEGLPTLDTLGGIGGNLHTDSEYVQLDSLVPRAQLATSILMQVANGEFRLPKE